MLAAALAGRLNVVMSVDAFAAWPLRTPDSPKRRRSAGDSTRLGCAPLDFEEYLCARESDTRKCFSFKNFCISQHSMDKGGIPAVGIHDSEIFHFFWVYGPGTITFNFKNRKKI